MSNSKGVGMRYPRSLSFLLKHLSFITLFPLGFWQDNMKSVNCKFALCFVKNAKNLCPNMKIASNPTC